MKFPAIAVAGEALGFAARRYGAALRVAWAPLALIAILQLIAPYLLFSIMLGEWATPDRFPVERLQTMVDAYFGVALKSHPVAFGLAVVGLGAATLLLSSAALAPLIRCAATGEEPPMAVARIDIRMRTLKLALAYFFCWACAATVLTAPLSAQVFAHWAAAPESGMPLFAYPPSSLFTRGGPPMLAAWAGLLLLLIAGFLVTLKLAPAPGFAAVENRFALGSAWAATRGRLFGLFASTLLVGVSLFLVWLVLAVIVAPLAVAAGETAVHGVATALRFADPAAYDGPPVRTAGIVRTCLAILFIGGFAVLQYAAAAGLFGAVYRRLTAPSHDESA